MSICIPEFNMDVITYPGLNPAWGLTNLQLYAEHFTIVSNNNLSLDGIGRWQKVNNAILQALWC